MPRLPPAAERRIDPSSGRSPSRRTESASRRPADGQRARARMQGGLAAKLDRSRVPSRRQAHPSQFVLRDPPAHRRQGGRDCPRRMTENEGFQCLAPRLPPQAQPRVGPAGPANLVLTLDQLAFTMRSPMDSTSPPRTLTSLVPTHGRTLRRPRMAARRAAGHSGNSANKDPGTPRTAHNISDRHDDEH